MGHIELADGPIYQEVRRRGKRMIRDLHKPPKGGDRCEGGLARGMISTHQEEGEEDSDVEADVQRQAGRREIEKFVHGIRNGKIVGGSANGRRIRHATREGNKPSFGPI
eukprot:263641-Pleurochrysis_carterae.AAC.1